MSDIAVSVRGLGKRYRLSHNAARYSRLTESLSNAIRHPFRRGATTEEFWALRDVSFDVNQGDVVGIIGRNGAGKSTLLRILSRITEPTEGEAVLHGRVSSLLEVGTGFHPELTGRENIYLSGSILGMRRSEIRRRFDEIVAFAEVDRFLDTPVKRFSSGMQVRLGFAVAAHLEPEILIVDEVLAVGDAAFQKKCLAKMEDVAHEGRTVLFVSHNMAAVEALCRSGVLMDGGRVAEVGSASDVTDKYARMNESFQSVPLRDRRNRQGSGALRIVEISSDLRTGKPSRLSLTYEALGDLRTVMVAVGLFSSRGEGAAFLSSEMTGQDLRDLPRTGRLTCLLDDCSLLPGRYSVNIHCVADGTLADWLVDAATVDVTEGDLFGTGRLPPPGYGFVAVVHRWAAET